MCGIVGYIGGRQATPILVNGLKRLEYRGYDSAGVAVWENGESRVVRCRGKLRALEELLETRPAPGNLGIGHTRWATHGRPSDENAHPHKVGPISVVHNGIIENHLQLRQELQAEGSKFTSETDTEIFAHLFYKEVKNGHPSFAAAIRAALRRVQGAYAIVVMNDEDPDTLICAKNASPMVVGLGEGENFVASDVTAILDETRDVIFIEEGEMVVVRRDGVTISDFEGNQVERKVHRIDWTAAQAEKGGFRHYMLKEIHEQPRALADTLRGRLDLEHDNVFLDDIDIDARKIKRVIMVACGTSYHASLVGEFLIEEMARIPVEVDLASEFRYRDPIVGPEDLVIAISQSGETADTMAAIQEAKRKGAKILAVSNVLESSIPRMADWAFYTHAGPEIGVASTKAFTTQLVSLVLIAIYLGRRKDTLSRDKARQILDDLIKLPKQMAEVIEHDAQVQVMARRYGQASGFLFLGRGNQYPIALEGALKLKEISYIHAEGYAAGEMKHGPIALIDERVPVIVIAPSDNLFDKTASNMQEVIARGGRVIFLSDAAGIEKLGDMAAATIELPAVDPFVAPILYTIPVQLLAYHTAVLKGTDVDQPRNLAKSVTVE
jgi:glutamine---fructose-6-phosphate transaminase (isomerizing)